MARGGPGRSHRSAVSLIGLQNLFPDEAAAEKWFAEVRWPKGRFCPKCGSTKTSDRGGVLKYWCASCRRRFSVRTGTILQCSRLPLRKWAIAIYLHVTSLKGVSSMKLHRDLSITQKSAWYMLHRIREAWVMEITPDMKFRGPLEVDETYVGGSRSNMHASKRKLLAGKSPLASRTVVAGVLDRPTRQVRAEVVPEADAETLQAFLSRHAVWGSTVYTDAASMYNNIPYDRRSVKHSAGEYVRGDASTNSIESFWATIKRAKKGVYHKMSPKHMQRYVNEFVGRYNIRDVDTIDQMTQVVVGLVGKRLMYQELISS